MLIKYNTFGFKFNSSVNSEFAEGLLLLWIWSRFKGRIKTLLIRWSRKTTSIPCLSLLNNHYYSILSRLACHDQGCDSNPKTIDFNVIKFDNYLYVYFVLPFEATEYLLFIFNEFKVIKIGLVVGTSFK